MDNNHPPDEQSLSEPSPAFPSGHSDGSAAPLTPDPQIPPAELRGIQSPKPKAAAKNVQQEIIELIAKKAKKAGATAMAIGIDPNKINAAAKSIGLKRAESYVVQGIEYVLELAKKAVVTDQEVLEEIALEAGIKLTFRRPLPRGKKSTKKGGMDE